MGTSTATTFYGGAYNSPYGWGTVFKITPSGTLTTLVSFDDTNGIWPTAGLVQGTDGNLYGETQLGGINGVGGTIFKITPSGTLTTLYNFCSQSDCQDGYGPLAAPTQDTNGTFYGTTWLGGASSTCEGCVSGGGYGTVFQPVSRPRPVCGNTAHLRQGGSGGQDSGKRSDGRDQCHVQRYVGDFHGLAI